MKAIICLDKHESEMAKNAYEVTCAIKSFYSQLIADYLDEDVTKFDKKTLKYAIETLQFSLNQHCVMDLFPEVEDDDFWYEDEDCKEKSK